jgi:ABC-type transport system substrate-binding protein
MNQQKREELTSQVQQIIAEDLPYIPLWYADVVSVHRRTLGELTLSSIGDYEFLAAPR